MSDVDQAPGTQPTPARKGRPPKPAEQRGVERFELRLTVEQLEKLQALGGSRWIKDQIAAARVKPGA